VKTFKNNESGYLAWVHARPDGFVANADRRSDREMYPMVHRATHKAISGPQRQNYTTDRYFKVRSETVAELEEWSQKTYGRALVECGVCMK
jgi:hypothetical protein